VAAGLLKTSSGTLRVFGEPLAGINRHAGYMFQSEALLPWRSALANVVAGLEFRGTSSDEARRRGEDWLERVGLAGFGDRYPHQLSGGMRKRTSLAQMLILDPKIVLRTSPSPRSTQTRQLMENELLELWAPTQGVIFITHDLRRRSLSDRVVVLSADRRAPVGEFTIDLPQPLTSPRSRWCRASSSCIWHSMKEEVLKGYAQTHQPGDRMKRYLRFWQLAILAGIHHLAGSPSRPAAADHLENPTAPPSSSASR
jgi:NitT/TauT family transport system ATP-binding protein